MTPKKRTPTTAAIYTRISKDSEGLGLGVERQESACRDLAAQLGVDVGDVYSDNDVSAYSGKRRPEFDRLAEDMRAGRFDTVLAWHPDRLTRRTRELEDLIDLLEQSKVTVHTVQAGAYDLSTPSGRMTARVVGAAAQHESEMKSARLRAKADQAAANGDAPGGRAPYGYRRRDVDAAGRQSGPYVIDQAEADVVRRMVGAVLAGDSMLGIAKALTADDIPTREGKSWHHSSVYAVVTNPAIAGRRIHRQRQSGGRLAATVGEGAWPAIIDPATFDKVAVLLGDPSRKRKRPAAFYLLTGVIRSAEGDRMVGRMDKGRRTYVTPAPEHGPWAGIDADAVEDFVVGDVLTALEGVTLPAPEGEGTDDVATIEAEMADLAKLRGEGVITLAEWVAAREPLQSRLDAAKALARRPVSPAALTGPGGLVAAWPDLTPQERRRALAEVVEAVEVATADGKGRWSSVEARVNIVWRI